MMNRIIFSVLMIPMLASCSETKKTEPAAAAPEAPQTSSLNAGDTLRSILDYTADKDSFYFVQGIRAYFRSGYLFDSSQKHAVVIYSAADDSFRCTVELYRLEQKAWKLSGKVSDLVRNVASVKFADYNFDGVKDILVAQKKSQATELTNSYLLTIDPKTNTLKNHPAFAELVSPVAEPANKFIRSIRIENGPPVLFCEVFSEWKKGELVLKSVNCPSASVN